VSIGVKYRVSVDLKDFSGVFASNAVTATISTPQNAYTIMGIAILIVKFISEGFAKSELSPTHNIATAGFGAIEESLQNPSSMSFILSISVVKLCSSCELTSVSNKG